MTTSSRRRLTSPPSPAGGRSRRSPSRRPTTSRAARMRCRASLMRSISACQSHRPGGQHDAHRGAVRDREVLVPGLATRVNRIANTVVSQARLDAWDAARVFTLVNFAMADGFTAGSPRSQLPLLASADRDPQCGGRREPIDGGRHDVGTVDAHAARTGLSVNTYRARGGSGRSPDSLLRRQGRLQRDEPHPAGRHPTVPRDSRRPRSTTAAPASTRASISAARSTMVHAGTGHRPSRRGPVAARRLVRSEVVLQLGSCALAVGARYCRGLWCIADGGL